MSSRLRTLAVVLVVFLSGCATYGKGMDGAITDLQQGNYQASRITIKAALKDDGNDRLLYNLELAVVEHLAGNFDASNDYLETAQKIAEDLETIYLRNSVKAMMSNPRQEPYAGAEFEVVFINYFKALNYFALAQQSASQDAYETALENANIEARRLIIRLNDLNSRKGNYKAEGEEEGLFTTLVKIFSVLNGNLIDMDSIQYRDDAMAHYLAGLSFEMNAQWDDARISYQKAAQSYDRGYAKQFRLGQEMGAQAWFDVVRMMRVSGSFEGDWQRLASQKLSKAQQDELKNWRSDQAQVVVIEHKGLAPQRKEMNLVLSVNPHAKAFELRPFGLTENAVSLAWFYLLYADKNWKDALANYLDATEVGMYFSTFTKTVGLGPLYRTASDVGLLTAIGSGLRVTVPYYEPVKALGESQLQVGGKHYTMFKASNPALMAIQNQMVHAGNDINLALSRAALKAITADQLKHAGNYGGLLAMAGKLTMQAIDAAETRNWLLLPQDIRIRRVLVEPGEQTLVLSSAMPTGTQTHEKALNLKAGEITLWNVRVLPAVTQQGAKKTTAVSQLKQAAN